MTIARGVVLWILVTCGNAWAAGAVDQIAARQQINIGYRSDASPFSYRDDQGKPAGYMIDLCRTVAAHVETAVGKPLKLNFVRVPIDQMTRYVQSGSVDLLCSATTDTAERRANMAFSFPVFISHIKVLVRRADGVNSLSSLRGGPMVVIGRSTADALAAQRGAELQWNVTRALNADAAMSQLDAGMVKGYARDDVLLMGQLALSQRPQAYALLPDALTREPIAIAIRPGDTDLEKLVNAGLSVALKSGSLEAAYQRWFMRPVPPARQALGLPMSAELRNELEKLR